MDAPLRYSVNATKGKDGDKRGKIRGKNGKWKSRGDIGRERKEGEDVT